MFYPFHSPQIILLNQQSFDLIGLLNLVAISFIGYFAWKISERQAKIAQKQSDLDDYADVFVRPRELAGTWEFQIRSACPRTIYLEKIKLRGIKAQEIYREI